MLRLSWLVEVIRPKARSQGSALSRKAVWLASLVFIGVLLLPAIASAAGCTNTYKGPSGGNWETAEYWSLNAVPTSSDVVCIGSGTTVNITGGSQVTGVLLDEGTLSMSGKGSLEIADAAEASSAANLSVEDAILKGAGELAVTNSFTGGEHGGLTGAGTLVIDSSATGLITGTSGASFDLEGHDLKNAGMLTIGTEAGLQGERKVQLINTGTLIVNGEPADENHGLIGSGEGGVLINTGTVEKTEGSGTTPIEFTMENEGTVSDTSGKLEFTNGGVSGEHAVGSWKTSGAGAGIVFSTSGPTFSLGTNVPMSGLIELADGTVTAGTIEGSGDVVITGEAGASHGTLELIGKTPSTMEDLALTAAKGDPGVLWTEGVVAVNRSFTAEDEASIEGPGMVLIEAGATGTVNPASAASLSLEESTLENAGTLTVTEKSGIQGRHGAKILNSGTLIENGAEAGSNHGLIASVGEATLTNTGTLKKTEGSGTAPIQFVIDNEGKVSDTSGKMEFVNGGVSGELATGSWSASGTGAEIVFGEGTFDLGATVPLSGAIRTAEGTLVAGVVEGAAAQLTITKPTLGTSQGIVEVNGSKPSTVEKLDLTGVGGEYTGGGTLTGSGEVNVTNSFTAGRFEIMTGTGSLVIEPGVDGVFENEGHLAMEQHALVIKGSLTMPIASSIQMSGHASILNTGTFIVNGETENENHGLTANKEEEGKLINTGTLKKTEGTGITPIEFAFENLGTIAEEKGRFKIFDPVKRPSEDTWGGSSPSTPGQEPPSCGDPVDCATGNYYESQTDLEVGGLGVGLDLTRTYNAQAAAAGVSGAFGHGWSSSFSDHLTVETSTATLHQANGGAVPFLAAKGESFTPPLWSQDSLSGSAKTGYSVVLPDQVKDQFEGSTGRLQSVTDRDGNQTKLAYNKAGQLETITDPAGRHIMLAYNGEGLVETAKDPMGHISKYAYKEGNLATVTEPGETKARWQYHYDGSDQMTTMIDGRGGETTNEYNSSHQVTSQTDPAGHKLKLEYEPFHTQITNNTTGSVTDEHFTSNDEPYMITHGLGTSNATTETFGYDAENDLTSVTDGNGHMTTYIYENGNKTSIVDPDKHETKWTYDGMHDIMTVTLPDGEETTITREGHGNAETVSRPAPYGSTQTTTYHYNAQGELTSTKNPLTHEWNYEYDGNGDLTSEADPEGNKRTYGYNEDSQETSTVSPRGNIKGGEPLQYTTKIEHDEQGRPKTITDPLGHTTKYAYNGDSDLETVTDSDGNTTTYTYNGDNDKTEVKEPNGATTETAYDGAGHVTSQTDGNKHTTTYTRNSVGEITEVKDPLGRVTKKEYDAAGNLTAVTDAMGRTAKYSYDPANCLKEISYSENKTPTVKYEYNGDGDRTKMIDGTGAIKYTYDLLDRLVRSQDGHGDTVGYEYDLAGDQTKMTYPSGNILTRTYTSSGRMQTITDWLKDQTIFGYDPDANLVTITFPKSTGADKSTFNQDDQVMKITMGSNGVKVLASLAYTRDNDGQVKSTITTGLPGTENISDTYDINSRLEKYGSTTYAYDSANEPTTLGANTSVYDAAGELKTSGNTVYGYDQLGNRVSAAPKGGQATIYAYNQADDLTQVKQNKAGGLNVTYTYDGNGLRASQSKGKTTNYMTWDTHDALPLIVSDEQNSYIYGPNGIPIEQIQNKGAVLYLHHDQQGSTRMTTSAIGVVEGTTTYDAYGNMTGATGNATSPLGYDGQYAGSDTNLIYLRARTYDPSTAQFLSVDPLGAITRAPYTYGEDNPLNAIDPSGLSACGSIAVISTICNGLEESGVSDAAAGALSFLTFGTSTELAGDTFGFNSDCANFGAGGEIGTVLGVGLGAFDGEDEAEVLAEGADEANSVTSTARSTPGADGAESVIIKERAPDGETVLVVHQVGLPLPGGGTIIIHQHAKFGPLPGSELFFPDVEP